MAIRGVAQPICREHSDRQKSGTAARQGTPVWYVWAKAEGHGFQRKANQDYPFYATVEFSQEYLLKCSRFRSAEFWRDQRIWTYRRPAKIGINTHSRILSSLRHS
jgi:hypothetical protein